MIETGVPLLQCLDFLITKYERRHSGFARDLHDVRLQVSSGKCFDEALVNYPRCFDGLYVSMIKSGTVTGTLDVFLWRLYNLLGIVSEMHEVVASNKRPTCEFKETVRSALFCRLMSTLLSSGIPILDCLDITSSVGDETMRLAVESMRDGMSEGRALKDAMDRRKFTPELVDLVDVGEVTGALDRVLVRMAQLYERRLGLTWVEVND